MSELNVPLLRKTLEHITSHPEEWDQGQWASRTACGTAFCVAGHVAVMTGHEIDWDRTDEYTSMVMHTTGGRFIENVAREELCLTGVQSGALFEETNSLHTLWELAAHFTDGEITVPPEVSA